MAVWPGGIGQALGDYLVTEEPLYTGVGKTWFVSSVTGDDTNGGTDATSPFATLGQALLEAGTGDMIVLLSGHTETYTATNDVTSSIAIVGAGSSGGKPTVKLRMNAASAAVFSVGEQSVLIANIWFQTNEQSNNKPMINIGNTANFSQIRGCYFELTVNDGGGGAIGNSPTGANGCLIEDCTFVATGTSVATAPSHAVATDAMDGFVMRNCVFDGGSVSFTSYAYFEPSTGSTFARFEGISLLRGADMYLASSDHFICGVTRSGSARIDFGGAP